MLVPSAIRGAAMRALSATVGGRGSAAFGGASGGLGTFGALHNACHYTCQILVTGLGLVGITLTGLPLAFLEDSRLVMLFGGLGVLSLGASLGFHVRARRALPPARGMRRLVDRRAAILLVFLLASAWSTAQGAARVIGSTVAEDAAVRTSKEGSVEVELTLLNLQDPSLGEGLVFGIALNSMDMSAPSFQMHDFKRAITLELDGKGPLPPSAVRVSDWGHMGHHLRGQVRFPITLQQARGKLLRLVLREIGGVEQRVLEWRVPATRR